MKYCTSKSRVQRMAIIGHDFIFLRDNEAQFKHFFLQFIQIQTFQLECRKLFSKYQTRFEKFVRFYS